MIITALSHLFLAATLSSSFFGNPTKPIDLLNTKWTSPINDTCSVTLCFNSDQTVLYQPCDNDHFKVEVGYMITGDKIEIEGYQKADMSPDSKLILYEDHGVLRQYESQVNSFPKAFVQVPGGKCE